MDVSTLGRRPLTWTVLAVGAALAVAALSVFQPWKLVVVQRVDEAAPSAAAPDAAPMAAPPVAVPAPAPPAAVWCERFAVSFAAAALAPASA